MSWIRWQGVLAFAAIVGLIIALWLLLTGPLLKHSIEKYGTASAGAKVELQSARVSFEPIGFKLKNFQMTNANKPMTNLFEFERAEVSVDFLKLLMGQVVINDLALEGIQFNTPRKKSGALAGKSASTAAGGSSDKNEAVKLKDKLPSVDEIMAREPLLTLQRKAELEQAYAEEKAKLDAVIQQLPKKDVLKIYQQRIQVLTQNDIKSLEDALARKQELDSIKQDIRRDKETIKAASTQVKASKQRLQNQVSLLKNAPQEDLKNIKSKYGLSGTGAANISKLLFGEQTGEWVGMAVTGYEQIEPFMGEGEDSDGGETKAESKAANIRAAGKYIHFPTNDPIPDFLLRKASLEILLDTETVKGTLSGELRDLSTQPNIIRRPATLKLRGSELQSLDSVVIEGIFNHIDAKNPVDTLTFNINSLSVKEKRLGKSANLGITMAQSKLDIQGQVVIEKGIIDGQVNSHFSNTHFSGQGKDSWARELIALLGKIESFVLQARVSGQLKDFDVSVSSDIDNQLKAAMKSRVAEKKGELEAQLMAKLNEQISASLSTSGTELDTLSNRENQLDGDLRQIDELLKAQVSNFQDQQKQQLEQKKQEEKDKLKEKLKDKLNFGL